MTAPDVLRAVVEDGVPVRTGGSSVVPWWSFTKTVIAATALALVRDGALDLDLDQPLDEQPCKLRQLLGHTAGLGDYGEVPEYRAAVARREDPWPVADLLLRSRAEELC